MTRSAPTLFAYHSFELRCQSRSCAKTEPWKSRPPCLLTNDSATGPLACSAAKFDWSTLSSWTNSVFGFTEVAQLHPGSLPEAPSIVRSRVSSRVPLGM